MRQRYSWEKASSTPAKEVPEATLAIGSKLEGNKNQLQLGADGQMWRIVILSLPDYIEENRNDTDCIYAS